MEGQLDTISAGDTDYKRVLNDFWEPFQGLTNSLTEVRITEVIDMLDAELGPHFFSGPLAGTEAAAASAAVGPLSEEEEAQRRRCPMCTSGRLGALRSQHAMSTSGRDAVRSGHLTLTHTVTERAGLKLSRNGGFIGCSAYPECRFVRPLQVYSGDDEAETGGLAFPHVLGTDPETGLEVALKLGPYGPSFPSPERKLAMYDGVGFAHDKQLLSNIVVVSAKRELGGVSLTRRHLVDGFIGPYVQRGDKEKGEKVTRASVAKGTAIAGITLEQVASDSPCIISRAWPSLSPLDESDACHTRMDPPGVGTQALVWLQGPRVVGVHPESQLEIELCNGVFGWYVRCDGVNASIPRRVDVDALDLATAAQLIDAKVEKLAKKAAKLAAEGRSPASKGKGKGKGKGKDTKRKKQKAAPGPRRPASAYLLYCKEHREAVKAAAAPELRSMVEVTKALAAQWKALPAAQRAPYEALAGAEKARYQELLVKEPTTTTTTSEAGGVVQKAGKATGTAKDHKAADAEGGVALPAKPAGAFFLFSREHREAVKTEHPEVKGAGPIAKILGQRWAELDPSVKADYQARAAADRARYDEQVQRLTQPV
jgi:DNA topoisomerase-1